MLRAFFIALLVVLGLIVLTHLFVPILAGAIAVGTGLWVFLIGSIVAFCAFIMSVFIVAPIILYGLIVLAFAWLVVAVIALPIMFPILLPLFIVMLFVIYARREHKIEVDSK